MTSQFWCTTAENQLSVEDQIQSDPILNFHTREKNVTHPTQRCMKTFMESCLFLFSLFKLSRSDFCIGRKLQFLLRIESVSWTWPFATIINYTDCIDRLWFTIAICSTHNKEINLSLCIAGYSLHPRVMRCFWYIQNCFMFYSLTCYL